MRRKSSGSMSRNSAYPDAIASLTHTSIGPSSRSTAGGARVDRLEVRDVDRQHQRPRAHRLPRPPSAAASSPARPRAMSAIEAPSRANRRTVGTTDPARRTGDDDDVAHVLDLPTRRRSQTCPTCRGSRPCRRRPPCAQARPAVLRSERRGPRRGPRHPRCEVLWIVRRRRAPSRVDGVRPVASVAQKDPDQAGQTPHRGSKAGEALVVEHRHRDDLELGMRERRGLVELRRSDDRRQLDSRVDDLRADRLQLVDVGGGGGALHYCVRVSRTPVSARPPPRSSAAPSMSPGISTS